MSSVTSEARPHGLFVAGGARVAVPLDVVREVIPAPARLEPLIGAPQRVLGGVVVRDRPIPVVDIGDGDGDGGDPTGSIIVLLEGDEGSVGFLCDQAVGVVDARPAGATRSPSHGRSLVAGHCTTPDGEMASVLDWAALASLPGLALGASSGLSLTDQGEADSILVLLVATAGHAYAIEAAGVAAVLPPLRPEPSVLPRSSCLGFVGHLDGRVPVTSLAGVLGRTEAPDPGPRPAVVLQRGGGAVALAVDEIRDMVRIDRSAIGRVTPVEGVPQIACDGVVAHPELGDHALIDVDALCDVELVVQLARLATTEVDDAVGATHGPTLTDDEYLVCDIDGDAAVRVGQIDEIVAAPPDLLLTAERGAPAVFTHRGVGIPLVDLGAAVGTGPLLDGAGTGGYVLVTTGEAGPVGFVVRALHVMARASWRESAESAGARAGGSILRSAPLLRIEVRGADALIPLVDLEALRASIFPQR